MFENVTELVLIFSILDFEKRRVRRSYTLSWSF